MRNIIADHYSNTITQSDIFLKNNTEAGIKTNFSRRFQTACRQKWVVRHACLKMNRI